MTLSEIAFRYRPVVWMVVIAAMVFGAVSYFTLPAREDPQITVREAVVTTRYPGLSAERIELLVTKTLEEAIRQVSEVDEIRSTSMPGVSIIHAEVYDRYFDLDQIWDEVRNKVEEATPELPDGTGTPSVNADFGDVAVVTAALTVEDWDMGAMFDMAQHVRDRLYAVDGTESVDILGAQAERIFIETSNARLAELGVSPDAVFAALADQNVIRPGGEIDAGPRSVIVEPTGNFDDADAIREALIPVPGTDDVVPLGDLATVTRGFVDPPSQPAYVNGERAIVFAVSMLEGYSVVDHATRVRDRLLEIEATLPVGYAIEIVTFQAEQVESAIRGVSINVGQTLAIVLAVVILFLGVRTGLIVGAIVPGVMLITLAIMGFVGIELQRMSLATLVIALGLLVDNGIVVAEDFKRRLEEGASRDEALRQTGGELAVPLLISTLTTVLVFLPLMLAEHTSGEYTRSISLVVLISLLVSWVLAMTVTPVLCHRFIRAGSAQAPAEREASAFDRVERVYGRLLRGVLRVRGPFLALMGAALAAAVVGLGQAPQKFFPDSDRPQVLAYVDFPAGVTTRHTDRVMREVFDAIDAAREDGRLGHVETHAGYVGFGGPRFVMSLNPIDPAPNKAFLVTQIDDYANVPATIAALRTLLAEEFPELSARVTSMYLGPSDSTKIEVQVKGPDADHVFAMSREIEAILRGVPGAIDIYNDWQNRIPKVRVAVDQARARRAGVTSADVAASLEGFYAGRFVTEFREGDDTFPVIARADDAERFDPERLRTVQVYARGSDVSVPLEQVADIEVVGDFARLQREDLSRTVTVEARNDTITAQDMVPLVTPALDGLRERLAPGHTIEFDGVVAASAEGQAALMANVPLCLALIVILLVAQFNGYARPAIILATIPLILVGAVIGVYALGVDFGFMPILGLYSLAGIIINNAIVLIDRIDLEREAGGDAFETLVAACERRLRPILMTTVTTILGLMPLIVFQDALFYGLASVMAFGLAVGTLLTLGVVPVLYSLAFRIRPARDAGRESSRALAAPA